MVTVFSILKVVLLILEIALFAYFTWILVKVFRHIICSIKAKDKKSILINSLIFTLCALIYFFLLHPVGRMNFIYQEVIKLF